MFRTMLLIAAVTAAILLSVAHMMHSMNGFYFDGIIFYEPFFWTAPLLIYFIYLGAVRWIKDLWKDARSKQSSWAKTIFIVFLLALLAPIYFDLKKNPLNISCWLVICYLFSGLFFLALFFSHKISKPTKSLRFADGAISKDQDKLGFSEAAARDAQNLFFLKKAVNVVLVDHELGMGKSSYLRMMIESLDQKDFLYTYLSLTETNEENDMGALFESRWQEALTERYPKVDGGLHAHLLESVLRNQKQDVLAACLSLLNKINFGLFKMKALAWDPALGETPKLVIGPTAKIFGHVPSFNEKLWIVAIEEIERAPIQEIYRMIEIIERFKQICRMGAPIRIVFIIVTDQRNLVNNLNEWKGESLSPLVQQFFNKPKTWDKKIPLPPVSEKGRWDYFKKTVLDLFCETQVGGSKELPNYPTAQMIASPSGYPLEHAKALEEIFTIGTQIGSYRDLARVAEQARYDYEAFIGKYPEYSAIRLSDVLGLAMLKFFYPKAATYLALSHPENSAFKLYISQPMQENQLGAAKDKTKFKLANLINQKLRSKYLNDGRTSQEYELTDLETEYVLALIGVVAHDEYDDLDSMGSIYEDYRYYNTTSDPELRFLYLGAENIKSPTKISGFTSLFNSHKLQKAELGGLSHGVFTDYFDKMNRLDGKINRYVPMLLELLEESVLRCEQNKVPFEKDAEANGKPTYRDAFARLIARAINRALIDETAQNQCASFLKRLAHSPMDTTFKYSLFSLGSGEDNTNGLFFSLLQRKHEDALKMMVQHILDEADGRYFLGSDDIYSKEERFIYPLINSWSAPDFGEELVDKTKTLIRAAAKRELEKHINAIEFYWRKYPKLLSWQSPEDAMNYINFPNTERYFEVVLPLKDLCQISVREDIQTKLSDDAKEKAIWYSEKIKDAGEEKYHQMMELPTHVMKDVYFKTKMCKIGYYKPPNK